jgi:preprotein translocase subunit SecY
MWLGEKITEHGIGNGISLIIFVNILGGVPNRLFQAVDSFRAGALSPFAVLAILATMVAVVAFVIVMTQATRKIPVQYAKRIVGRRMFGGASTHIPLRVNTAGVIPIIFASSLMILPATVSGFVSPDSPLAAIGQWFNPLGFLYNFFYAVIIIFFTYFYTAVVLNPNDLAENMRKYGGFVPGIRPGKRTAEYIDTILARVTLAGAVYLALIAILPEFMLTGFKVAPIPFIGETLDANLPRFVTQGLNVPFFFGGTSLLIVVGVAMDTVNQVESQLIMRHYDGFMKKTRIRGRRG